MQKLTIYTGDKISYKILPDTKSVSPIVSESSKKDFLYLKKKLKNCKGAVIPV